MGCDIQVGCFGCEGWIIAQIYPTPCPRAYYGVMDMFSKDGPSRGHATRHVLMDEAERRVRAGEQRSVVARELQIPASTMAVWAARGCWRKIDLDREAAGFPPLPQPYYARDDRNLTAGSSRAPKIPKAAQGGSERDLTAEAHALGAEARDAFERGDLVRAERKLKEARRLLRLEEGLSRLAPARKTRALDRMSDDEMRAEIRRLVGLDGPSEEGAGQA